MREIKFRAFKESEKQFYYFDTPQWDGGEYDELCFDGKLTFVFDVLEQYTGLLDKNGKEIYEGDIVRAISRDGIISEYPVNFYYGCFRFHDDICQLETVHNIMITHSLEIIGNIHEA